MAGSDSSTPIHGGQLRAAAMRYGIPLPDWLDLSTGINPLGWPVAIIPDGVWARLPEDNDGLVDAASRYYGTTNLLPVAGSQAAIQRLPALRRDHCRVGVITPSYSEHAYAWRNAGHAVQELKTAEIEAALDQLDVLILVNPNNPTGEYWRPDVLLGWQQRLAAHGGWLIVDEAYIDPTPELSLVSHSHQSGLIVLRSLGKFFGLAGLRVGFVFAEAVLRERLAASLGPWAVANPSRWVAAQALVDTAWQLATRERLLVDSRRLCTVLQKHDLVVTGGCVLFQWIVCDRADIIHERFARQGILTRLFIAPMSLRFGLPGTEADWFRLDSALSAISGELATIPPHTRNSSQ
jgi:cobalamin biosynthetic protein CobC